jgi:hypothetical protein
MTTPSLQSQVAFTESFAVRFDDVDVLLDECMMWVTFGTICDKPRRLSIRDGVQLQLARLLVDVTETQRKGCLSMRIEDSIRPAAKERARGR